MITLSEYYLGRDQSHRDELTREICDQAKITVDCVNQLLDAAKMTAKVNSGWRPKAINAKAGGAPKSKHMTGQACDLADPKGDLGRWCLDNLAELERIGLWIENPERTAGWLHAQIVAPRSGRRVFNP